MFLSPWHSHNPPYRGLNNALNATLLHPSSFTHHARYTEITRISWCLKRPGGKPCLQRASREARMTGAMRIQTHNLGYIHAERLELWDWILFVKTITSANLLGDMIGTMATRYPEFDIAMVKLTPANRNRYENSVSFRLVSIIRARLLLFGIHNRVIIIYYIISSYTTPASRRPTAGWVSTSSTSSH